MQLKKVKSKKNICCHLEGHWVGVGSVCQRYGWIRIRIRTKMSQIRNTAPNLWEYRKSSFWPSWKEKKNFCLVVRLSTFPQWSNQKMFSPKSYYLSITNNEIVQNSKSEPKKFTFLGTFNSISPDLWRRCHPRAGTRFWHCWWLFFSWSKIFFPIH